MLSQGSDSLWDPGPSNGLSPYDTHSPSWGGSRPLLFFHEGISKNWLHGAHKTGLVG